MNAPMRSRLGALVLLLLSAASPLAAAVAYTWVGGSGPNWSNNNNWNPNTGYPSAASDTATFDVGANDCTIDVPVSIAAISIQGGYNGTITQGASAITVGASGWTQAGGTFAGSASAITMNGAFALSGGTFTSTSGTLTQKGSWSHTAGTFSHNNGTVTFDGNGNSWSISVPSTETFYNLTVTCFTKLTLDLNANTLVVEGTFTDNATANFNNPVVLNNGTIEARGNVSASSVNSSEWGGTSKGTATLALKGTADQSVTSSLGRLSNLVVNKPSGTVTCSGGELIIGSFSLTSGTFTSTNGKMWVTGNWSHTAGTFNHNSGTVEFYRRSRASAYVISVPTTETFYNLSVSSYEDLALDLNGNTLVVLGTFTNNGGVNGGNPDKFDNGTLELRGNIVIAAYTAAGTATVNLTGVGNQTFTCAAGGVPPGGTWTVNKTSGTVTLATALSLNTAGQDLAITQGTLSLASYNLTVNDQFAIGASGNLRLQGGETISKAPTANSGTVEYTGDGAGTAVTLKNWTYSTLSIASTTGMPSTFSLPAALTVSGNLSRSGGTLDATASNYDLSLGGNWLATGGSFTARAATVTLSANTSHTITGSSTFNNLSQVSTAANTLTFEAGSTQTITGTLTLQGASGQLMSLRSTSPGTRWNLDAQGTRTLAFLDVMDSNSTNATVIDCRANGSVDSGNNVKWMFATPTAFTWTGTTNNNFNTGTNWYGGAVPGSTSDAVFSSVYPTNCTVNANANVKGVTIEAGYSGTITQGAFTITVGSTGWNQAGGTFTGYTTDATKGITIGGNFALSGGTFTSTAGTLLHFLDGVNAFTHSGGTFNHSSGTVELKQGRNSAYTISAPAITFYNLTLNAARNIGGTLGVGNVLTVNNTLTYTAWDEYGGMPCSINNGTIDLKGSLVVGAASAGRYGGTTVIQMSSTGAQSITGGSARAWLPNLKINKSTGTVTATGDIYVSNLEIVSGTFTSTSGALTLGYYSLGNWTHTAGGTFNHNNGTVIFKMPQSWGSSTIIDVMGTETFYNLKLLGARGASINLSGDTLDVLGKLTLDMWDSYNDGNNGKINNGVLQAEGDVDLLNSLSLSFGMQGGTASVTFTGTNNQLVTHVTGNIPPTGTWTVNKTGGSVQLATALSLNTAGQDLAITQGTFDLAGYNLTVNDQFTLNASGTLKLQGGETVNKGPTSNSGTVEYTGTAGPYTVKNWSYQHLTINGGGAVFNLGANATLAAAGNLTLSAGTLDLSGFNLTVPGTFSNNATLRLVGNETTVSLTAMDTDSGTVEYRGAGTTGLKLGNAYYNLAFSGTGSWTQNAALTLNGGLTVGSGVTLTSAGNDLALAGNWSNSGTYTPGANTVTFSGTSQSILGTSTFNNLTKTVGTAATLTFEAAKTQTIAGTLNLQGAASNLLSLRSTSPGTRWNLDAQGTRTLAFLDVMDSNSTNATVIDCRANGSVDSGNNVRWMFTTPTAFTWTGATNSNFNTTTNWYGGAVPINTSDVVFSGVYPVDCSVNANANVKGVTIEAGYAATITQGAFTITVGSTGWTQAGGTFTGGSGTITLTANFAQSGGTFTSTSGTMSFTGSGASASFTGGTFNHNNGKVHLIGGLNSAFTITGTPTFYDCSFDNTTGASRGYTISTSVTVQHNLLLNETGGGSVLVNTGTVNAQGDITAYNTGAIGTGTIEINGTAAQQLAGTAGGAFVPKININKSSGTLTLAQYLKQGSNSVWSYTAGTVDPGTSTLEFQCGLNNTIDLYGTQSLNHVILNKSQAANGEVRLNGATVTVRGDFTVNNSSAAAITTNNGTWVLYGNATFQNGGANGSAAITFSGSNDQTLFQGGQSVPGGTFTINKSSGAVILGSAMTINTAGQDLTITQGTLSLAGYNLTVNDQFTIGASGTLRLQGGETISKAPTANVGTVEYTGDGAGTAVTLKNWTYAYLDIASTTGTPSTFSLPAALTVSGNLSRSGGTLDATASNYDLSLGGNWLATGGSFTARAATVTLSANTSHTITGSSTFNNLSQVSTAANTLTFEAGSTQTVGGTLTLQGASGNRLRLRSTTPGSPWKLAASGSRACTWLDVQDGTSLVAPLILPSNSLDSLGNVGWFSQVIGLCWGPGTSGAADCTTGPVAWNLGDLPLGTTRTSGQGADAATTFAVRNVSDQAVQLTATAGSSGWTIATLPGPDRCWLGLGDGSGAGPFTSLDSATSPSGVVLGDSLPVSGVRAFDLQLKTPIATTTAGTTTTLTVTLTASPP